MLLSRDIGLRDPDCRLIRLQSLDIDRALLLGCPAFIDQRPVPVPGHLGEPQVRLRLGQCGLVLIERGQVLRNLVTLLGHRELDQLLALFDAIANVDVTLGDVAGRAGIDLGLRECGGRRRQGHRHNGGARPDHRDAHAGHEITLLLRSRHDLLLLRIVAPCAERNAAGEQQECACREQATAPSALHTRAKLLRVLGLTIDPPVLTMFVGWPVGSNHESQDHSSGRSSNTPWAATPSLRLRSTAKR